jgi:hypothetical protein
MRVAAPYKSLPQFMFQFSGHDAGVTAVRVTRSRLFGCANRYAGGTMIEDFPLLFASRAALFEFAFDDALFAFAYARPPLALALLFERPTTRHVVTIYLFVLRFRIRLKPRNQCVDDFFLRFVLRFFCFMPPEARCERVGDSDTFTRLRFRARTFHDESIFIFARASFIRLTLARLYRL